MIPDDFIRINVTDTCAVWNVIGSDTLFRAARQAGIEFIVTPTILYECFVKTRGAPLSQARKELRERLSRLLLTQDIARVDISIEDLQDTILMARSMGMEKRVGPGELSCVALARHVGHAAVLTDNRRDFRPIAMLVEQRLQTTARLLGWLYLRGLLGDTEVGAVIEEHRRNLGHMADVYAQAHHEACEKRLMQRLERDAESAAG